MHMLFFPGTRCIVGFFFFQLQCNINMWYIFSSLNMMIFLFCTSYLNLASHILNCEINPLCMNVIEVSFETSMQNLLQNFILLYNHLFNFLYVLFLDGKSKTFLFLYIYCQLHLNHTQHPSRVQVLQ